MIRMRRHWAMAVVVCGLAVVVRVLVGGEEDARPVARVANAVPAVEQASAEERIAAALATKVDVAFDDATLDDVAAWVRERGGVDVVVDRRAILDAGIDPEAVELTRTLKQVSLEAALWHLLRRHELVVAATDDALVLTTDDKASTMMVTRTYAVGDLIRWRDEFGRDHRDTEWLGEVIYATCNPSAWSAVGGPGGFAFFDDAMAVSTDWDTQRAVVSVLTTLREAIERQATGDYAPIPIGQPSDGGVRVTKALRRKVDVDVAKMPLTRFAKLVSELAGVNVIVDEKSLADAGLVAEELEVSGTLKNSTLEKALWTILREAEIDFVATHEILLLYARGSGCEWPTSSLYPVADFDVALGVFAYSGDDRTPAEDLTIMITSIVGPGSWPVGSGPGPVKYIEPWDLLLIEQTNYYHREIEELLTGLRRVRAEQRRADRDSAAADADPIELRVFGLAHAKSKDGEASGPTATEVARLVRDLVEPQSWAEDGAYLRAVGDRILVRHRRSVQRRVRRLIAVLQAPERVERDYSLSPVWQSADVPQRAVP